MQIRLTVLGPRGTRACDVLVTAPTGTALGAVAGALATSVGAGQPGRSPGPAVTLYAGADRLAPETVLGVPPLVEGAVLALRAPDGEGPGGLPPADPHALPGAVRLHVTGGPDAGGVHLLQGGPVRVGRSADADVPLDDPDVSRLHCAVTVDPDGRHAQVADLGSTNGTSLDGRPIGPAPVPFPPGALLRIGESTLILEPAWANGTGGTDGAGGGTADGTDAGGAFWDGAFGGGAYAGGGGSAGGAFAGGGSGAGAVDAGSMDAGAVGAGSGGAGSMGAGSMGAGASGAGASGAMDAGAMNTRGMNATRSGAGATNATGARADASHPSPRHSGTPTPASGTPLPRPVIVADAEGHLRVTLSREGGPAPAGPAAGAEQVVPQPRAPWSDQLTAPGQQAPGGPGRTHDAVPPPPAGDGERLDADRAWPTARDRSPAARPAGPADAAGDETVAGRTAGRAIGAWARRIAQARPGARVGVERAGSERAAAEAAALRHRLPDPAAVLVTALGPGPRLWERGPRHPDAFTVRLGTADLAAGDGVLPSVPVAVDLRRTGSLALSGPRPRLSGLARAVVAQLCALHSPGTLEVVLVAADRSRPADARAQEWAWLNWLPHLRPAHGQDCRLLVAFDRDQAEARIGELLRRLDETAAPATRTLVVVDGDPGSAGLRESLERLAQAGPGAGVHLLCLAGPDERPAAACGAHARLDGDVATALALDPDGPADAVVDAVSAAWAERFGRALAPLREADGGGRRSRGALPETARLLDALDLALATPAKVTARWSAESAGPVAVLGTGADGPVAVDLSIEGPHLLVGGAAGSGKTELLRSVAAAMASAAAPRDLVMLLVDGAADRGEGLRICTDLPHVRGHLAASDPVRMREFAQALTAELKRREEVLGGTTFDAWHAGRRAGRAAAEPGAAVPGRDGDRPAPDPGAVGTLDRPEAGLPRLVVVVDDFDALTAPALGAPGRPAAGSVVRAVEAVARAGVALGVHLVAATGRPERTAGSDADGLARLRIALRTEDPESAALLVHVEDAAGLDEGLPGRGYLRRPGGAVTAFQAARVSGRIPRTATLRPTVVALEWDRMGDPPARRPLRELGNGPTDLALLASALQRAADTP
ncbi:FtsK/SpoIIIE domain-containing protein [Streptomyces sp. SL13]|uniref:FtsK/SpoIIIE domain-containing protein n=1 Tax=Streptantibioticus silvisoli TaxID=2705255 RepID=A0AA90JZZ1_9ACTN|nr:FtsK/SpoIIIE domain-containing protein [Streptantibioticus silvisoli]MDI5972551.1 FtsK/SpoIIIE domain-containing protein [Streptantibioticus silvisoli]